MSPEGYVVCFKKWMFSDACSLDLPLAARCFPCLTFLLFFFSPLCWTDTGWFVLALHSCCKSVGPTQPSVILHTHQSVDSIATKTFIPKQWDVYGVARWEVPLQNRSGWTITCLCMCVWNAKYFPLNKVTNILSCYSYERWNTPEIRFQTQCYTILKQFKKADSFPFFIRIS